MLLNCRFNSCSAVVIVSALKKRLQDSGGSIGTEKASCAEEKRISCLIESWNFFNRSFFLSSFSRECSSCRSTSLLWVSASSVWRVILWASCWRIISLPKCGGGPMGAGGAAITFGGANVVC